MNTHIGAREHHPARGGVSRDFVFTSGTALDEATGKRSTDAVTIKDEVRIALDRIEETLAEAGMSLMDLTKITAWVSEERHRLDFAYAYRDLLAPGPYPSRALFQIGLTSDCRVQIDATAARPTGD